MKFFFIFSYFLIEPVFAQNVNFREHNQKSITLNGKAVQFVFRGDKQKALKYFNKALEYEPNNTAVLYNLAGVQLAIKNPIAARASIKRALEIKPKDLAFLNRYGEILMKSKEFYLAKETLEKMLEIEPNHLVAKQKLAICHSMLQNWEQAETVLKSARNIKRDNRNVLSNLGKILLVREKFNEAINNLEQAQRIRADADTERSLAIAYEAIGLTERANNSYKRALSLRSNEIRSLIPIKRNIPNKDIARATNLTKVGFCESCQ